MRPTRILRAAQLHRTKKGGEGLFGVGVTKFNEDFVLHDENDPYVPGTKVRRLRRVPLGERAFGFFEDETYALVEGLRTHRDAAE
jgi:hypothetical protein